MAQLIGSKSMKGRQKAAALLIALGPEVSAEVLKHFRESEIETLTFEVFQLEKVTEETKGQVLEECYHMAIARDFITSGGAEYARDMLVRALGKDKAQEIIERMAASRRPQRFGFVRDSDPAQLAQFVGNEHPQTIALILAHLNANQAAQTDFTSVGGTQFLVNMLTTVDRGTEKQILEYLDGANGELAAEVRKLMFVFDDLVRLDDRSLQRVLREVDSKDLSLAMRGTSEELQERIFRNQSTRASQALKEEMEIGGPVRLRQVEEAQQRIVNIVRRLEDSEEIVVQRGGEDVLV